MIVQYALECMSLMAYHSLRLTTKMLHLAIVYITLVLASCATVNGQDLPPQTREIGRDDPCAAELGVASPSDNLSCEFIEPICYPREELCDGNRDCLTGSDEGDNIPALDCKSTH